MKNTKNIIIGIGAALLIILLLALIFNSCNSKRLQGDIDTRDGKIAILTEQVEMQKVKLREGDSVFTVQGSALQNLKVDNAILLVKNKSISDAYSKAKVKVSQYTSSQTVDAFKEATKVDFPVVLVNATPDSSFEVPKTALKNADELFVTLDEEYALNDNLHDQNVNFVQQIGVLGSQVENRQEQIKTLIDQGDIKTRQIDLLNENEKGYQQLLKKQQRNATIFKITTTAGIIAIAILLLK